MPFDTDFIRFKIVDKKVPKRTAIQETVLDAVRSYNEVIEIAGKSTVRTVYALPKFTIPDDKLLMVELYEKNGGRHQSIRVENADIVNAKEIDELEETCLYNDTLCAVPAFQPGTGAKIPAGHEGLAGYGGHGGRGALEQ